MFCAFLISTGNDHHDDFIFLIGITAMYNVLCIMSY